MKFRFLYGRWVQALINSFTPPIISSDSSMVDEYSSAEIYELKENGSDSSMVDEYTV